MSLEIRVRPIAKEQINDAVFWYDSQSENLGNRFLSYLDAQLTFLANYPKSYHTKYNNIRSCKIPKFPFIIHFAENIPENALVIFAVIHAAKRPKNWNQE